MLVKSYLRPGRNEGDPAVARFELDGTDHVLFVGAERQLSLHRVTAKGKASAKPVAAGRWFKISGDAGKRPVFRASFKLGDTEYEVGGWPHTDPVSGETYLSLDIKPAMTREAPRGFFPV